jgi:chromosome segregation ATPase
MIEPIMYIGIGFLVAGLLVIGIIPMVHARAVRLTQRRLEAVTPMSMAEIHADKDQLRAEFAMSTRRLEMSVEQTRARASSQLAELGKKSDSIGRLKLELGEKAAAVLAAEAKINATGEELAAARSELVVKSTALRETERKLEERTAELAKRSAELNDSSLTSDSQRVEVVALQAQAEALKGQIEGYEQEIKSLRASIDEQNDRAETANALLAEERIKTDAFAGRIKEFEGELSAQTTETEILGRRVQELLARLDEHERLAVEHEFAAEQLGNEAAAARKNETRHRVALEALSAEKAQVDEELRQALEERERLEGELAAVKREAENAWNAERMEATVMRERVHDVAAEVARLTAALEGPNSPIETILADAAGRPRAGPNGTTGESGSDEDLAGAIAANRGSPAANGGGPAAGGGSPKGSLADRIRALQKRRARVPRAS